MAERIRVTFTLNGERRTFAVPAGRRLLDLLRDDAGLCGTKEGCGAGECGACTVLLDGRPVTSCLVLAASVEGRTVVTVEGLGGGAGVLHPFQRALVEKGGVQCGFCTPGVAVAGAAILAQGVSEPAEQARLLSGNLCRCTGYTKIFEALEAAREGSNG
ncbi:MAG: (2Fe-2S)-binding protein [Thermoanaerobaculaceae bacterium]